MMVRSLLFCIIYSRINHTWPMRIIVDFSGAVRLEELKEYGSNLENESQLY